MVRSCIWILMVLCTIVWATELVTEDACGKYERTAWKHWIDSDKDCQNTRHEVLFEESLEPVSFKTAKNCRVVSGAWLGAYSGNVFTDASQLDIDHLSINKNLKT